MTAVQKNGTPITKAAFPATPAAVADPLLQLTADVYEATEYQGSGTTGPDGFQAKRTLKWKSGTKIKTSERDALYVVATVTGVTPATGPLAGGTAITIAGTNLAGVTGVTVGGAAATNLRVHSQTKVTCTTPAGTAGAKNVVVADDNAPVTLSGGFTYA